MTGLEYLIACAVITIVVLAWDSRHHPHVWRDDD